MKLNKAKIGQYVAVNQNNDATVFQIQNIEGRMLVVKEVVNGSTENRMKPQVHDVSLFELATEVQLVNAGLKAMPGADWVQTAERCRVCRAPVAPDVEGDPTLCSSCKRNKSVALRDAAPELLVALRDLILVFTEGRNYDTMNPYTRPEVKRALLTMKQATGFQGDWMDVAREIEGRTNKEES